MNTLLGEIGKRFPDRWLINFILAGLIWASIAFLSLEIGHARALDLTAYGAATEKLAAYVSSSSASTAAAALRAVALAVVSAMVAQGLMSPIQMLFMGRWRGPLAFAGRRLAEVRRSKAARSCKNSTGHHHPVPIYLPQRPTWIGDRFRLADARVYAQYHLHLVLVWPRLWLLLDSDVRNDVRSTRHGYESSLIIISWSLLYFLLGIFSWPCLILAPIIAVVGWRRSRGAAADFAELVESVVDIHHPKLAEAMNCPLPPGGMTPEIAVKINDQLNKGA